MFLFDRNNEKWTNLGQAPEHFGIGSSCGLVTKGEDQEIVVTTTYGNRKSFILSMKTLKWREGQELPYDFIYGASVQFR
jgi:hypothetical protein